MKVWESESFTLNFKTGELERAVSNNYFRGVNFEQAQLALVKANMPWLRLTGNWFTEGSKPKKINKKESTEVDDIIDFYEGFIHPKELTKGMSLDDFYDWLDLGNKDDVEAALREFKKVNHDTHVPIIEGYLKNKYGDKNQEGLQQSN